MLRRLVLGFAGISLGLSVWTACTGDDPVSTATGAVGQPCNTGNTCNAPELKCIANVCQTASAASSSGSTSSGSSSGASSSGSTSSGGESSSSGGSVECKDLTNPAPTDPVLCPIGPGQFQACKPSSGELCCPGNGGCKVADKCGGAAGADDWQCLARNNCPAGAGCYIKQSDFLPDAGTTCNVPLQIGFQADQFVSVARCLTDPPGSPWVQLCNLAGDCDNAADCSPAFVQVNGAKILVKACKEK